MVPPKTEPVLEVETELMRPTPNITAMTITNNVLADLLKTSPREGFLDLRLRSSRDARSVYYASPKA